MEYSIASEIDRLFITSPVGRHAAGARGDGRLDTGEPRHHADQAMIEERIVQVLETLGVPYELMEIDPAFADTAACCEKYGLPLDSAGNTIVVASKKEPRKFGACVVQATTRLDVNHSVRALLGATKVSFASADETKALTGMMIGGVTVFALPPELPIYVDDKLMQREWVILGSGSRSSKIKISPEIFRRIPNATIVPGLSVDI
jgi:prolyl-tRNA editing enzyme YbaK/EbsC (Cys-tRNA(Pro) deacylase)